MSTSAAYFSMTTTDNPELSTLLNRFQYLFEEPSSLPSECPTDHVITLLSNSTLVKVRPYHYPYSQKQEIEAQVARMLISGEIRPSTSAFSSPILLVKKKDNTWRFCVNYRALNAITVLDSFPIPTIHELLDELGAAIWFSKLDLLQGYHQIRMKSEDIHKIAFLTYDGHFELWVLPFGISNAPATFQATTNALFRPHLRLDASKIEAMLQLRHFGHFIDCKRISFGPLCLRSEDFHSQLCGFSAYHVATLFFDVVGKLHGMPKSIVSDREPLFLSKCWQELFKASGTQLRMSSSYHPETDGKSEVLNRTLEQYLRAFCKAQPVKWSHFIPWAEWCYNTTIHSATGYTPFEIVYGRSPPSLPGYILGQSQVEVVDHLLSSWDNIISTLRRNLQKAQARMKSMADIHRPWVYVKLRPYCQTSLVEKTPQKLAKRYFGPFQILSRIGPVAYRLALPETSKIHPVFHCYVLKPHHGPPPSVTNTLSSSNYNNGPSLSPLVILGTRENNSSESPHLEVLVQWQP
ncbi:hypothetical protein V8G54_032336 [Vigna mungo]|uniref:Integrase catalytic domain-containing protein n=1 Tax=Vigna mungo TaxID=3915 RepID=A0AAQ3MLZ6_VIGMU